MSVSRTPKKNMDDYEQVKLLVHKRGLVKAKVTRISNSMKAAEKERRRLSLPQLRVFAKNLSVYYSEYNEIHDTVIAAVSEDRIGAQEDKYMEFETLYNDTCLMIESMIDVVESANKPIPSFQSMAGSSTATDQQQQAQPIIVQNQSFRIPLPTFDGRYEAWPRFKAMFQDMMQRSTDSEAVKLYHLENSLKGEATGVIDLETLQNNNYDRAWEILEERFGNQRLILESHILGILNLQKMTRKSSKELRRLVDECSRHIDNLVKLNQALSGMSELLVITVLTRALDDQTRELWEASLDQTQLPEYETTIKFLKQRCVILERCEKDVPAKLPKPIVSPKISHAATAFTEFACEFCTGTHQNYKCPTFLSLTVDQRHAKARETNVCFNCLRKGHRSAFCPSDKTCTKCSKQHHTLLHFVQQNQPEAKRLSSCEEQKTNEQEAVPAVVDETVHATCSSTIPQHTRQVLLMTAIVTVTSKSGRPHHVRALLDSGSQVNFLTESVVKKLNLPKYPVNVPVIGVGAVRSQVRHKAIVCVTSHYSDFTTEAECLVTPKVTGIIPSAQVNIETWNIPPGVVLADSTFNCPQEVEMLIGAELFFRILKQAQLKLSSTLPTLYETHFGWVVAGAIEEVHQDEVTAVCSNIAVVDQLEASVQRFFIQEELLEPTAYTAEEQEAEDHFQQTYRRDATGRFVVQLPFRESINQLGNSRPLAMKRFLLLEKRLARNPNMKGQYGAFIQEYEALGHCREIDEEEDCPGQQSYYLPHHAILKPTSSSTKLRVVFDATAKANGLSLNEVMKVGPTVQSDLFTIVLRFRKQIYAFSTDVTKMYRQIRIDPSQTRYQRVLWRNNPSDPVRVLELQTVTYGTSAASFLAVRSVIQLARDECVNFPEAAESVVSDCYMDDILTGGATIAVAQKLRSDIEQLLLKGGFPAKKWCSNAEDVLEGVAEEDREKLVRIEDSSANETIKALGLLWDPKNDQFLFCQNPETAAENAKITKRYVLSQISKMFDPLGLISPVVVLAKILMQRLWASNLGWDDHLEGDLFNQWTELHTSLGQLGEIKVPRCVLAPDTKSIEVHGFADASSSAYGACLYLRCVREDGSVAARLLCSKSKVAPLHSLTIPRLELCAALLLARLVDKVIPVMKLDFSVIRLYSDSQIFLAWRKKHPESLEIYVRNRIIEINKLTTNYQWLYVKSEYNPADIVSRGLNPEALSRSILWWKGPDFLGLADYETEAVPDLPEGEIPELKREVIVNPVVETEDEPAFHRISSFQKLQRVFANVVRFTRIVRLPEQQRKSVNFLRLHDMREAMLYIVRVLQQNELHEEIRCIKRGELTKRLANLQPFIDEQGLVRVGGRLQNSKLPYEAKHQLVLPQKHPVTEMLIRQLHEERFHEGPSGLLAAIRQEFWLTNARSAIRKVTRSCIKCFRAKPRSIQPLMGSLPECRVNTAAPFEFCGVDYAGPVFVKEGKHKPKIVKAYICLFVCLVTKAIHVELVSDLTTAAFLAALDRFINRRGKVRKMLSDNATNFVGASKELHQLFKMFRDDAFKLKLNDFLLARGIEWEFIPPRSPNFGGIWEAGVKVVKTHINRTLSNATLTFEEFVTALTNVEAIVNSRPLYALSDDPNEPLPITPAHLLLGRPLEPVLKPSYSNVPSNRLSRWQYVNQLRDHFWSKWSRNYLSTLQSRAKWTKKQPNIKLNTIVLLNEDNQPAQTWRLGLIVAIYPGKDETVRVADVKTSAGVFRRAISKLAPLPIQTADDIEKGE